jgi:hypothetical protein
MNSIPRWLCLATLAICCLVGQHAAAQFQINVIYDSTVTPQQQSIFELAAQTWESHILGYQPGITITGLTINASTPNLIDPPGQDILGLANATAWVNQGGFRLSTAGFMQFDSENVTQLINQGYFDEVVIHEMGHVLGIGINWISNGVYVNGSGRYTGQYGLAAYNAEYGQTGSWIPVELSGGASTANKHWNEVDNGAALTGIHNAQGRDLTHELMTGWLNIGQPPYIANFTIQSLRDIGFRVVEPPTTVPEPATVMLLVPLVVVVGLGATRRATPRGSGDSLISDV